jgi:DNA primase
MENLSLKCGFKYITNAADPDHFDLDPDPTFHFDAALDSDPIV